MSAWPVLHVGSTGEDVRTLQYLLEAHGVHLAVDGAFGPHTKAAVEQFQTAQALTADGIVGNQTWAALVVTVASGSNGPAVRAVQSQMAARIARPAVTGSFDAETDELVRSFQGDLGLIVDGIVGSATWLALVTGGLGAKGSEEASQAVFQAWTRHDAAAARKHATADAVAQLFARSWSASDGWRSGGCDYGAGHAHCTWTRPGGSLTLACNNGAGAPFFYVEGVTFEP